MKSGPLRLTYHERNVMLLLAGGLTRKQIAGFLHVSSKSVSAARRRVLNRHGLLNDVQLGRLIERCQLIPPDEANRIEDRREERIDACRMGAG